MPRVAASLFAKTSWPSAAMKKLGVSAKWSRQANGPRRVTSSATLAANARTLFLLFQLSRKATIGFTLAARRAGM